MKGLVESMAEILEAKRKSDEIAQRNGLDSSHHRETRELDELYTAQMGLARVLLNEASEKPICEATKFLRESLPALPESVARWTLFRWEAVAKSLIEVLREGIDQEFVPKKSAEQRQESA